MKAFALRNNFLYSKLLFYSMAVVKVSKKDLLEKLIAKITLRLGNKPTQQDVLDLCIEIGFNHFEEVISRLNPNPVLSDEKIEKILNFREEAAKIKWYSDEELQTTCSQDDFDIYMV